jgi:hypothetical protein
VCGECEGAVPLWECGTCYANDVDASRAHPLGGLDRSDELAHVVKAPAATDYEAKLREADREAVHALCAAGGPSDVADVAVEADAVGRASQARWDARQAQLAEWHLHRSQQPSRINRRRKKETSQ